MEFVNVIWEDFEYFELFYVGIDYGLYIFLDKGKYFMLFDNNLFVVVVYDLAI